VSNVLPIRKIFHLSAVFPIIIANFGEELDNWSSKEKGLQYGKNLLGLLSQLSHNFSLSRKVGSNDAFGHSS
jgi:hypothetical protein